MTNKGRKRHCPMCKHLHRVGPTGEVVCGGDRASCRCDPKEPCKCDECWLAAPLTEDEKRDIAEALKGPMLPWD